MYLMCKEGVEHFVGVAAAGDNPDAWMSLGKCSNEAWQEVLCNRLRRPNFQLARLLSGSFSNGGKGLIGDLLHLIGKRQQHLAARGQGNAPPAPIEESNPEFVLERLHLLGHRGLG